MEMVDVRDDDVEDDQPVPPGMRYEHGKVVPAPDRGGAGGSRQGGAPRCPDRATLGSCRPRPGPIRSTLLEEPGRDPGARAGADPLRADARLAVHLLPGRGADHGRRPRRHAALGADRPSSAATPTCRTSACSARRSGAWSSTSTTSTRPSRARGSGTSSASRPASRSPAATTASRRRTADRAADACSARTARRCASSPAMTNLEVWYAHIDVETRPQAARRASSTRPRASGPRPTWPRPAPGTACRRSTSSPTSSTASGASSATRR